MATRQHIDWVVSASDALVSPLGYKAELGETRDVSPVLCSHSTFEGTGEFELSVSGDGGFEGYPSRGLLSAPAGTSVRLLLNGEDPATLVVASGRFAYRMSTDCKRVIASRQVCDEPFLVDSVSCDRLGRVWAKDTSGTLTVMGRGLEVSATFRLDQRTVMAAADPDRMVIWQVMPDSIRMVRMADMSASMDLDIELDPPSAAISSIISHDFSSTNGSLLMVVNDGISNHGVVVTLAGEVIDVGLEPSSVCQWGNGALFCTSADARIHVFEGGSIVDS